MKNQGEQQWYKCLREENKWPVDLGGERNEGGMKESLITRNIGDEEGGQKSKEH